MIHPTHRWLRTVTMKFVAAECALLGLTALAVVTALTTWLSDPAAHLRQLSCRPAEGYAAELAKLAQPDAETQLITWFQAHETTGCESLKVPSWFDGFLMSGVPLVLVAIGSLLVLCIAFLARRAARSEHELFRETTRRGLLLLLVASTVAAMIARPSQALADRRARSERWVEICKAASNLRRDLPEAGALKDSTAKTVAAEVSSARARALSGLKTEGKDFDCELGRPRSEAPRAPETPASGPSTAPSVEAGRKAYEQATKDKLNVPPWNADFFGNGGKHELNAGGSSGKSSAGGGKATSGTGGGTGDPSSGGGDGAGGSGGAQGGGGSDDGWQNVVFICIIAPPVCAIAIAIQLGGESNEVKHAKLDALLRSHSGDATEAQRKVAEEAVIEHWKTVLEADPNTEDHWLQKAIAQATCEEKMVTLRAAFKAASTKAELCKVCPKMAEALDEPGCDMASLYKQKCKTCELQ